MQAARDNLKELTALAEQLAAEPFCRKYGLERQSLAKVSLFMEQRDSSLERVAPEQASMKASFQNFKAIYCLFLMQLEQSGPLDAAQLNSLALKDYLSEATLFSLGMSPGGTSPNVYEEVTMIGTMAGTKPPAIPSHEEGTTDATMVGNIVNLVKDVPPPVPKAPPIPDPNQPVVGDVPVSWDVPSATGIESVEQVTSTPPDVGTIQQPTTPFAQEYFSMALHFKGLRNLKDPSIPAHHLMRLESQQVCFAIEIELQEKITSAAQGAWPQRKSLFAPYFSGNSDRGELQPTLVRAWEALAQNSSFWPANEKLPLLTLKNSLRFLSSATDTQPIRPSLLEAGLWLFVAGQDIDLGGLILTNSLGIPAFEYDVFGDAFLRLCRVHRLKSMLLNPSSEFLESERAELESHAIALFALSQAWK